MRINGIHIGELDTLFTIEQPTFTPDSVSGEQTKSWSTFTTVWGKWVKMSNEKFEGDQQVASEDTKALIRYVSGLTETMRLSVGGEYHYIKGIDEMDRKVTMLVKTEKRNNG